jgi:hypothetical protein
MKKIFKNLLRKIGLVMFGDIISEIHSNRMMIAKHIIQKYDINNKKLIKHEFKVFSQCGEDGIIQYLINNMIIDNKTFIEFGVQNYTESNTRFLLVNNNWNGLVYDGSKDHIDYIKNDNVYWMYSLKAEHIFIDAENIDSSILQSGMSGDIGLLSVDIDGNDYWVWKNINSVSPRIVVCEYNSLFGCDRSITVPYLDDFDRTRAHFSNLYFGASLLALTNLANSKGYKLVGGNSEGSNAFFVRNDLMSSFEEVSVKDAYIESKFRESRGKDGLMTFLSFDERLHIIKDMPLYDTVSKKTYKVSDL